MATEAIIVRPENVNMIAQQAPQVYNDNRERSERCINAGNALLQKIMDEGMTDELDRACSVFLEKSRKTVKLMNEQRSPFTKMFDCIRSEFTMLENGISVTNKDSVSYKIQAFRNQFATQKHNAEEQRRRDELLRKQKTQAVNQYESDVEFAMKRQFGIIESGAMNKLTEKNGKITIENFDRISSEIREFPTCFPCDYFVTVDFGVSVPQLITEEEAKAVRDRVMMRLINNFCDQYAQEVGEYKDTIVSALPSKKKELANIAKATAEEAERMRRELAAKEYAETQRVEAERKKRMEEEHAAQAVKAQVQEMNDLFSGMEASVSAYQPNTSVKKKVVPLDADGVLSIISFWWSRDGKSLTVEELAKMFSRQIKAVERYANDKQNPELISSEHVRYEDEVKAK